MKHWLFACFVLFSLPWTVAEEFLDVDDAFQFEVERVNDEFIVRFAIAPNYYLYRDNYKVNPFEGAAVSEPTFDDGVLIKYDPNFDEDMAVFYDEMVVQHVVEEEAGYLQLVYQGCADAGLCYAPQKRNLSLSGEPIDSPAPPASLANLNLELPQTESVEVLDLFSDDGASIDPITDGSLTQLTLLTAIIFAFAGGLALNLMPCVFPVLSFKALHFAQMNEDKAMAKLHGLAYTMGVIISFLLVAAIFLGLRAFGGWVGWGFQLQSPYFVALLVLLFFVMSLTMYGFIEFGQSIMGVGQGLTQKSGSVGSFFSGVLATVVATPCTAPFMGSAIGFALLQPAFVSLVIFAAMGLGLALPILLVGFFPVFARWLPKPGAWMTTFRQFLAFPLFATALWLLWVLVELRGSEALLKVGLGLIFVVMALWPALTAHPKNSSWSRWFKRGVRTAFVVAALVLVVDQREQAELWQDYSAELLTASVNSDRPVFLDVTASWCITCKANERVALSGDRFEQLVEEYEVILIRADWTNPSAAVDGLINSFNRQGVPLYAYYSAGSTSPEVLPQILTFGMVEEIFSARD